MGLDERLRRELERTAQPADPTGAYEDLIRRRERRRIARRVEVAALAIVVAIGSTAGIYGLSRVFGAREPNVVGAASVGNGRIAFVTYEEGTGPLASLTSVISTISADGTDRVRLAEVPGNVGRLDWSPDGTRLLFGDGELSVLDATTSEITRIAGPDAYGPSWSPDGTQIAYTTDTRGGNAIVVVGADGTDERTILDGNVGVGWTDWSPDGSRFAFVGPGPQGAGQGWDIYVADVDGSDVTNLTDNGAVDLDPQWSPDGEQIVFRSRRDQVLPQGVCCDAYDEIYVMNADGSEQTRLTFDESIDQAPTWSPDGSKIAYTSQCCIDKSAVVIMDPDGSNAVRLPIQAAEIAWQPVPVGSVEPVPSESPSPQPSPIPSPSVSVDIGLGFPVCNVSSIKGRFASPDINATISVATRGSDVGGCPQPEEAFNVLALDSDQDGLADTSYGPVECTLECRAFSAPDIDGDGTDELLVVQDGGAVVGLRLYDVVSTDGEPAIVPVNVAEPGDPQSGLVPLEQASFLLGGDAFELYTLRCETIPLPWGLGLVATSAEALPHDSADAEWHAHQTTSVLRNDGLLHILDVRDFIEPVTDDPEGPSFQSGEMLCASNLGP